MGQEAGQAGPDSVLPQPPFDDLTGFAEALDRLLSSSSLSLRQLSKEVGVTASTISSWRTGRHIPYPRQKNVLIDLLKQLGIEDGEPWLEGLVLARAEAKSPAGPDRSGADPVADPTPGPGSSRRRRRMTKRTASILLVVVLALLAALLALVAGSSTPASDPAADEEDLAAIAGTGCPFTPGGPDAGAIGAAAVRIEYEAGGGEEIYGCGLTPLARLPNSPLSFQEFGEQGRTPANVIVAFDDGGTLTLPFAAWGSYRQIGGKSGDSAHAIAGDPVGLRVTGVATYLELDSDVQLVAEKVQAPYFFVVAPAGAAWADRGGPEGEMGLPTSNLHVRFGRWRQEFENGWLEADSFEGSISWNPVDSPGSEMPSDEVIAGRIVGQLDGTAWLITPDLQRKWIPDGLVWDCLGGANEAVTADTPGYAIAQLPYDGIATCADS